MIVALLICCRAREMLPPNSANTIFAYLRDTRRNNLGTINDDLLQEKLKTELSIDRSRGL
ncbi:hypothetical protein HanPSC8_Chr04g0138611 [Helianthus annuus]|nr:hypothetical protein HanPSC8_Chr04g0138611 [Helianthus annuus]